ncbi:hypothetical protein J2Y86_000556 [Pseudomonas migulae]|nr:hypothetical protein [Pseudomonas migulae]
MIVGQYESFAGLSGAECKGLDQKNRQFIAIPGNLFAFRLQLD